MAADAVPIAIKPPSVQAIGSFVLPKNCIYTIHFCSSEGFPGGIDALMDLLATIGDLDWAAATDRDRIETSARGFLERNAAGCVDGAVNTANGSITIEIKVEVGFKGNSSTGIGIDPVLATDVVPIAIEPPSVQAIGRFVLPKNGVYTINCSSSEGFPAVIDAFIDLLAAIADFDRAAATDRDGIKP